MKVCTRDGQGALVNLWTGELLFNQHLKQDGLGEYCKVVADSLDEFVREDEENEPWHDEMATNGYPSGWV